MSSPNLDVKQDIDATKPKLPIPNGIVPTASASAEGHDSLAERLLQGKRSATANDSKSTNGW